MHHRTVTAALLTIALATTAAACGSDASTEPVATESAAADAIAADVAPVASDDTADTTSGVAVTSSGVADDPANEASTDEASDAIETIEPVETTGDTTTITAEIWADNWFSLSVNGVLIGEDSVPITTERSFNAETFTFEATLPLTIAIEAKDFKETDSGLEYIGERNQQMGDGGIIAQFTDAATGDVIAATDSTWSSLVVHRAPLNTSCEQDPDPDATCEFEITETPADWAAPTFDDSDWSPATVWSEAAVSPKDGYDQISWDPAAELVWGSDLEVDNTVLLRTTVDG